jgi:hypothetical protein
MAAVAKMLANGEIRSIPKRVTEAQDELSKAVAGIAEFGRTWEQCGLEQYFGWEEYVDELLRALDDARVAYHRMHDVLYVYPSLVRLDRDSKTARIDKKSEARVRPRSLAGILGKVQNRPRSFPAAAFLRALLKVYRTLGSRNLRRSEVWTGKPMLFRDIYDVWSATPGANYSLQEFVRDIYLLDASGEPLVTGGYLATLEASSSARDEKRALSIVTRDGQRRLYCTIRFDPVGR